MKLADKILALRKKQGISQEELAEKLSVSRQTVSRWEMGSALPDASNILHLSRLFEVTADYLLNDDYENDPGAYAADNGHKDIPEASTAEADRLTKKVKRNRLAGCCIAAAGVTGNFIIYVLSRIFKVMVPRTVNDKSGQKWFYWSSGIRGYSYKYFIQEHSLEFLTAVFWFMVIAGLIIAFLFPVIRRKAKGGFTLPFAGNGGGTAGKE